MFECFVMFLVLAVVVCFCIQLSLIEDTSVGEVFLGYVPNDSITQSSGLFQACGILGATVCASSYSLLLRFYVPLPTLYNTIPTSYNIPTQLNYALK